MVTRIYNESSNAIATKLQKHSELNHESHEKSTACKKEFSCSGLIYLVVYQSQELPNANNRLLI